jgi:hypothetical protein
MIRNLYDYLGNKTGELNLPDDTPEYIWQEKIANAAKKPDPIIPPDVTPRQIRQAIIMMGGITIEQIEAALNQLPEPTRSLAKIEWEYSISFKRKNPFPSLVPNI